MGVEGLGYTQSEDQGRMKQESPGAAAGTSDYCHSHPTAWRDRRGSAEIQEERCTPSGEHHISCCFDTRASDA